MTFEVMVMAHAQSTGELHPGEERVVLLEDVFLLAFCFLLALGGLGLVVWELATGRFFSIDGLWLTLISLALATVFGGNIAWSIYTDEVQAVLQGLRKGSPPSDSTSEGAAGSK
jgi:hypothetical protein